MLIIQQSALQAQNEFSGILSLGTLAGANTERVAFEAIASGN